MPSPQMTPPLPQISTPDEDAILDLLQECLPPQEREAALSHLARCPECESLFQARVRDWVGNGVERLVRRALVGQLDGEPSDEEYERAYPIFLELYAENTSKRSHLFDGVEEGLAYLRSTGIRLGCVTNKAAQFTEPLLRDLGIAENFEIVISGDSLPEKKPHPMPLLHGAEFFGVKPENAMMIGDSVSDVKASRAAGFQIVCMSYGYNHGQDIREANPDA